MKADFILLLEYIRVLIWPVIIAGVIIHYRRNFSAFIDRLWKLKFPGGELEAERQKESQEISEQQEQNAEATLGQQQQLIEEIRQQYESQYESLQRNAQQVAQQLLNEISIKDLQLDFERIYNTIFGSQIRLLEILLPKQNGERRAFLEVYYQQVKRIYYPTFESWTLDMYLRFLFNKELVGVDPATGNYKITQRGIALLSYITNLGYTRKKNL